MALGLNLQDIISLKTKIMSIETKQRQLAEEPYHLETMAPAQIGKTSFLVFQHNKYITVPTRNIAFFYVKYDSSTIAGFDRQEHFVNYSLEQIQRLVSERQFFRVNRQYLINFQAIKEVEHYFARKLLVNLHVPVSEKILVSREKVSLFLEWLEDR
jgi:DNA-binding LytR/AlgR family response regulator